ncbi:uncharacterized protein LOC126735559 [Anthonomus grandis grandis]|uniref:uncharacterized protein LOC126735559 n=1 Tax=Anthonomus grandis grandis TaxID=2921223 RepID=UPI0021661DD3|nr:uncharacterized protein LOC126735559 [Anthonomus grandis grandis]
MQAESVAAGNGEEVIPLAKVQERVAAATGVSITNIRRIKNEAKLVDTGRTTTFLTPNKKRPDRILETHLDEADLGVLRRTIINHHVTEREVPTLKIVHKKFVEDTEYHIYV